MTGDDVYFGWGIHTYYIIYRVVYNSRRIFWEFFTGNAVENCWEQFGLLFIALCKWTMIPMIQQVLFSKCAISTLNFHLVAMRVAIHNVIDTVQFCQDSSEFTWFSETIRFCSFHICRKSASGSLIFMVFRMTSESSIHLDEYVHGNLMIWIGSVSTCSRYAIQSLTWDLRNFLTSSKYSSVTKMLILGLSS